MIDLSHSEIENVHGGFAPIFQAILIGISIFVAPSIINDKRNDYGNTGAEWSQNYWDNNFPYDPNSNGCYGPSC
jgi:hypothetical protein